MWHKLVLTIIGITGVVLILALYISDQSVKKGFLSYINQVESNRLDGLAQKLVAGYQENNNWEFIRDNRRLWRRYNQRSRSPLSSSNDRSQNAIPRLQDIAEKVGDIRKPPRGFEEDPDRARRHPPRKNSSSDRLPFPDDDFSRLPPPRGDLERRGPPRRGKRPPPRNLILLDTNKQFVIGGGQKPQQSSDATLKNLNLNDKVIGYLQFEPFTKFTDELDKQFIQYQNNAFLKIALLALGIILFGAALFAAYLRFRINKIGDHAGLLTSGNFSSQSLDKSKDELGQLSSKLDVLGKTLEGNRLARQRWVSDISHELRTPVAVLQGEIEAMQDGIRKIDTKSVNSLHHETLRLSRLITDLHQLSQSDTGSLTYVTKPVNLVELLQDVIVKHQYQFDSKNIKAKFNSSHDELMVSGDEQRLEQLFSNLANNSQHYTHDPGQLEISLAQQNDTIIVEWTDSEPGVTDDELAHLFERLYRVEESRNRNEGGSGLGLSICKNIVAAHEGTIIAKHSPLGGITFVITFKNINT
ncbi:MAG: ATP-binding protein [Cocleimonas sp.]